MTHFKIILFGVMVFHSIGLGQKLSVSLNRSIDSLKESDYKAGPIVLGSDISKILSQLPTPKSMKTGDEPQTGGKVTIDGRDTLILPDKFSIYEFDSLMIQTNGWGSIDCFIFTTTAFETPRGIRVGDTIEKVIKLYGLPSEDQVCAPEPENEDGVLAYCEGSTITEGPTTTGIAFFFRRGIITRISVGTCVRL